MMKNERKKNIQGKKTGNHKKNDGTYSVENSTGMTVEELIEGIRGKIQRSLEEKAEESGRYQK